MGSKFITCYSGDVKNENIQITSFNIIIWWGRVLGTYFIYDVEKEKIIIKEMVHDGVIPFQQFQKTK